MRVSGRDASVEELQAERQRVMRDLEKRIEALTKAEKSYMEMNLIELNGGDLDRLHRLALFLMAGLPLGKFVGPLFSAAFSASLAPTISWPHREFKELVQFNYVDWAAMREAFLETISCIGEERSSVGNWTVARALRSTGDLRMQQKHRNYLRCLPRIPKSARLGGSLKRTVRLILVILRRGALRISWRLRRNTEARSVIRFSKILRLHRRSTITEV